MSWWRHYSLGALCESLANYLTVDPVSFVAYITPLFASLPYLHHLPRLSVPALFILIKL